MKYYYREVTVREVVNKFGKLGFKDKIELVKTNNIDTFNYRKQYKFKECGVSEKLFIKRLRKLEKDVVYRYDI